MKKLLYISFLFLIGCSGPEIEMLEVIVTNGQSIHFNLPKNGIHTLTLIDNQTNQVISRERFVGQAGENVKKIYTKSLQSRYLYVLLEDVAKNQIGKTTIIIK
jgi:hypothetical protein